MPTLCAPEPTGDGPTRISFLILPRFNLATLITMIEPLRVANYLAPQPLYSWEILSLDGAEVPASNGMTMAAAAATERNRRDEAVFVLASWGAETYRNKETEAWVRRQSRAGAMICAVELGCYVVARAGLLAGRQIALHWSWAPGFAEQFDQIAVTDQLYTPMDRVFSCAGGMAGLDLMIDIIARQHGPAMAGEVADQILHNPLRGPDAPQRLAQQTGTLALPDAVSRAIALIEKNIAEPLSVPQIAAALGASQRQLERQFRQAMGCTVVQFGTLVRLQHARVLLISTQLPVREVATASGFNTLSHFAHAFGACFGRRPSDYRQGWPKDDPTPSWPGTLAAFLEAMQNRKKLGRAAPA